MPILILTATAFEQQTLRDQLTHPAQQEIAHNTWTRGILGNRPVILIEGGIGLVNTAHALTVALQQINPELVIQTGIGGAYLQANLNIGDLVLATEENYAELGVITPQGWHPADEIGIPVLKTDRDYFNTYPLDTNLVSEAKQALQRVQESVSTGPFVTVQQCSGRTDVGNTLSHRFNAICENMEGVAAAQICLQYNIPFIELRAISNQVEDRNKESWNIPLALERAQTATSKLIQALS
ncbi:MAG: futalosine hydrolase [Candidatus Latescibacterota bacterium]|jgi:futalosine hydrolase